MYLFSYLFAAALLMVSIFMMPKGPSQAEKKLDEDLRQYFFKQFRRRTTVCYLIGSIGIMIAIAPFVESIVIMIGIASFIHASVCLLIYWSVVLLLVAWIVGLAGIDMISTSNYYLILRDRQIVERRVLEEVARKRKEELKSESEE
ncbi:MAG: hypothetical protein COA78_11830 [Blastopirellula sp.]|nr:MAG: hypothetical protein COA78_11830 [Blastopirellula sp.]